MCFEIVDTKKTSVGSLSNSNSCHAHLGLQESENNAWEDSRIKNNAWQNKTVHSRVKTTDPEFPKIDRLNFQSTPTDFNVSFILLRWTYLNTHKCFPIHYQISTLKTTYTFVMYKGKKWQIHAQVFTEVKKNNQIICLLLPKL